MQGASNQRKPSPLPAKQHIQVETRKGVGASPLSCIKDKTRKGLVHHHNRPPNVQVLPLAGRRPPVQDPDHQEKSPPCKSSTWRRHRAAGPSYGGRRHCGKLWRLIKLQNYFLKENQISQYLHQRLKVNGYEDKYEAARKGDRYVRKKEGWLKKNSGHCLTWPGTSRP